MAIVPSGQMSPRPPASRLTLFVRFFPSYLLAFGVYGLCTTVFGFDPPNSGVIFEHSLLSEASFSLRTNELFIMLTLAC